MEKDKGKKRTLTISSSGPINKDLGKNFYNKGSKKPYIIDKKKNTKSTFKPVNRNFNRKFVEQQATKRFIHSDKKNLIRIKKKKIRIKIKIERHFQKDNQN